MLWLHGKSNSAIISEEMLFLKVAEPLPELHQVVVEGGERSRQGHLGVEIILMAVGATNINVSVGDGDKYGDQVIRASGTNQGYQRHVYLIFVNFGTPPHESGP